MLFGGHAHDDWCAGHGFHHWLVLVVDADGANKLTINNASKILEGWRVHYAGVHSPLSYHAPQTVVTEQAQPAQPAGWQVPS